MSKNGKSQLSARRPCGDRGAGHGRSQDDWISDAAAAEAERRLAKEFGAAWVAKAKAQWRDAQAEIRHQSLDDLHPFEA